MSDPSVPLTPAEPPGDPEPSSPRASSEPTTDLLRDALDETRRLVQLEVALAREELKAELRQTRAGIALLGAGVALGLSAVTMLIAAAALAFAQAWLAALLIGAGLLCLAGCLAYAGSRAFPRKPLDATKQRVESDLKQLKERIA
jgi:hypothetical protein